MRSRPWIAWAVLILAGLLVYGQVVRFGFVTADDTSLIAKNPHVLSWWSSPLRERLLTFEFHYAMPVTLASFALDHAIGGGPFGFHLTNLLLHLACASLVLRILLREVRPWAALAGAMLFLLHPVQVEAVAFVTQRKDLLAGLFGLLALDVLSGHRDELHPRDVGALVAFTTLAALSKPTGATLGLSFAVALLVARRPRVAALVALPSLAVVVLDGWIASQIGQVVDLGPMTFARRAGLVGSTFVHYVECLLFPVELAPRVIPPKDADGFAIAITALALVGALAVLVAAIRRRALATVLLVSFLLFAYAPISNLVPIARYVADAYLYVAMIAIALACGAGAERVFASSRKLVPLVSGIVMVFAVAVLSVLSAVQTSVWRDEERLFGYVYLLLPDSPQAFQEYVDKLRRNGKPTEAQRVELDYYGRAVVRWPDSLGARQGLVHAQIAAGDLAAARATLDAFPPVMRDVIGRYEAELEWATAAKDAPKALTAVRAILARDPNHPARARLAALEAAAK